MPIQIKQKNIFDNNTHLVIISNETGIFETFSFVKATLIIDFTPYLSLIYIFFEQTGCLLFEKELHILEKRFSGYLTVYKLHVDTLTYRDNLSLHEFIEAFINADISEDIKYKIFGSMDFSDNVCDLLFYLGAKTNMIDKIIIKK